MFRNEVPSAGVNQINFSFSVSISVVNFNANFQFFTSIMIAIRKEENEGLSAGIVEIKEHEGNLRSRGGAIKPGGS